MRGGDYNCAEDMKFEKDPDTGDVECLVNSNPFERDDFLQNPDVSFNEQKMNILGRTGARVFNNLRPEIRKVYTNKESFKTKLEFLLKDNEVLINSVPLQRLSLLNQIRSYNDKYHNQFETG